VLFTYPYDNIIFALLRSTGPLPKINLLWVALNCCLYYRELTVSHLHDVNL